MAVLLLALDRSKAARLLKHFDPEELRAVRRLAFDLRPVSAADLEALVEEFARLFATGVKFVGSAKEVEKLLSDLVGDELISDATQAVESEEEKPIWSRLSEVKEGILRAYLSNEHPQTAALILSKIESSLAARILGALPAHVRNSLLVRMLGIKSVSDETLKIIEDVLRDELLSPSAGNAGLGQHASIADILNRLDRPQLESTLQTLMTLRPDDAKAIRSMLFAFEDLASLDPKALVVVVGTMPIETLVIALRDTEPAFQEVILSSLASRSRRMAEAELQSASNASARDIAEARRAIVETVLRLMREGKIEVQSGGVANQVA